jgi:hypothetical protein
MKKLSMLLVFVASYITSFGQTDGTSKTDIQKDFLRKSKNQRTTGFVLLGIGTAVGVAGALIVDNSTNDQNPTGIIAQAGAGGTVAVVGSLVALTSVPFFISAGSNKKKANRMSAGISFEKFMGERVSATYLNYYPALTARLSF